MGMHPAVELEGRSTEHVVVVDLDRWGKGGQRVDLRILSSTYKLPWRSLLPPAKTFLLFFRVPPPLLLAGTGCLVHRTCWTLQPCPLYNGSGTACRTCCPRRPPPETGCQQGAVTPG